MDYYKSWNTEIFHPNLVMSNFPGDSLHLELGCGENDFIKPVCGVITSEFGWRKGRPHLGTDINLKTGDPVKSAFAGKVRIARFNASYGNVVILRHENGLETVYAHLSKLLVKENEDVECGKIIGLGGNTGHSFGSHLHFEVRFLGKAIDSREIIDYETGKLKSEEYVIVKQEILNARKNLCENFSKKRNSKKVTIPKNKARNNFKNSTIAHQPKSKKVNPKA
jgi:murein DD-endopeptidase MepM/ murein hydrolase activator NlpD